MAGVKGGLIRQRLYSDGGRKSIEAMVRIVRHPSHSKSFPTVAAAQTWLRRIVGQVADGKCEICAARLPKPEPAHGPTVSSLFAEYAKNPKFLALKPRSQKSILECLHWLEHRAGWGALTVEALTPGLILAFQEQRIRDGVSGVRLNKLLGAAFQAMRYCRRRGLIHANPLDDFEKQPESPRTRVPTAADVEAIIGNLPPAYRSLAKLLSLVPGRLSETLALNWGDVDLAAGEIRYRAEENKSGRERTIFLSLFPGALELLTGLGKGLPLAPVFKTATGDRLTLDRAEKLWRKARTLAGIQDLRLHDLRHLIATRMASAGVPEQLRAYLMGHVYRTENAITMRYEHLSADHFKAEAQRYLARQA